MSKIRTSAIYFTLLFTVINFCGLSLAQAQEATNANEITLANLSLYYGDLEAMAKASITDEVDSLNDVVAKIGTSKVKGGHDLLKGYNNNDLKVFQTYGKPEGIDPSVLYKICVLTSDTVAAITSPRITEANLHVFSNLEAVTTIKTVTNSNLQNVVESACVNARARFTERLKNVTSNGLAFDLDDTSVNELTKLVFFPTDFAKPSLVQKLLKLLPLAITGALIISQTSALAGVPLIKIWAPITGLTSSSLNLNNMLRNSQAVFQQNGVQHITVKNGVRLDLTEEEKQFDQAS